MLQQEGFHSACLVPWLGESPSGWGELAVDLFVLYMEPVEPMQLVEPMVLVELVELLELVCFFGGPSKMGHRCLSASCCLSALKQDKQVALMRVTVRL